MHKGIGQDEKFKDAGGASFDDNLGNFDLLNLSLSLSSNSVRKNCELGSGDTPQKFNKGLYRKLVSAEPNPSALPQGYENFSRHRLSSVPFPAPPATRQKQHHLLKTLCSSSMTRDSFHHHQRNNSTISASLANGNLQLNSQQQILYESKKLSFVESEAEIKLFEQHNHHQDCLMASDRRMNGSGEFSQDSAIEALLTQMKYFQPPFNEINSIIGEAPVRDESHANIEYNGKETCEILDPELNLCRLGYTGTDPIAWGKVGLPEKKDLYLELCRRITNKRNADCKVLIANEEFNCHLIVMQCYSDLFDGYIAIKKVEIPEEKCSAASFAFIYNWMVSEEQFSKQLRRETVLDIFNAAKYLKIRDLVEQCWAFIDNIEVFNEDTAFLLYIDAKNRQIEEVCELMMPRIQHFFLILVSSQNWLELEVSDVKNLLKSNYIRLNNEMEVFMSAIRWLKYDWANRDKYKVDVLNCVRFGNIAPWQLVDIKRNPENPEFMDVAKDPAVMKMLDDGMAYVIIKYWYLEGKTKFDHWNSVLGLHQPLERNWTQNEKTYFTYREFLIYLDQYRRNQLIEKSKPVVAVPESSKKKQDAVAKSKPSCKQLDEQSVPSMEDFLMKRKGKSVAFSSGVNERIARVQSITSTIQDDRFSILKSDPSSVSLTTTNGTEIEERNVLKMFTVSKHQLAQKTKNQLSSTILPNRERNYLSPTSLFLKNRETILVFGGIDPYTRFSDQENSGKEIYQYLPDSNCWLNVGEMPEPRHYHSVGFMRGRVYVAGGVDPRHDEIRGRSFLVGTVWSFDPVTRTWYSETSLEQFRRNFGLIVCNQKMYAIGGFGQSNQSLASVERFDPIRGVWDNMAPMKYARGGVGCVKYRDWIWAAGGTADLKCNTLVDATECYNIKTNQWTSVTKLRRAKTFCSLFVMSDVLYVIGGVGHQFGPDKSVASVNEMEAWDQNGLSWVPMPSMAVPRHSHAVGFVGTQIFVLGGVTTFYLKCLRNCECYCTKRATWLRGIADFPRPLSGHAAITLPPAFLISNL